MSATQDNEEPCGRGFGGDVANPLAWSPMRPEPASRSIEDIQQTISKMQRMYEITGATHYLNQGIALSEQTLGSVEPNGDDDARLQGVIRSLFFETSSFTRGNARELAKLAQKLWFPNVASGESPPITTKYMMRLAEGLGDESLQHLILKDHLYKPFISLFCRLCAREPRYLEDPVSTIKDAFGDLEAVYNLNVPASPRSIVSRTYSDPVATSILIIDEAIDDSRAEVKQLTDALAKLDAQLLKPTIGEPISDIDTLLRRQTRIMDPDAALDNLNQIAQCFALKYRGLPQYALDRALARIKLFESMLSEVSRDPNEEEDSDDEDEDMEPEWEVESDGSEESSIAADDDHASDVTDPRDIPFTRPKAERQEAPPTQETEAAVVHARDLMKKGLRIHKKTKEQRLAYKNNLEQSVTRLRESLNTQKQREIADSAPKPDMVLHKDEARWLMKSIKLMKEELSRAGTHSEISKKMDKMFLDDQDDEILI